MSKSFVQIWALANPHLTRAWLIILNALSLLPRHNPNVFSRCVFSLSFARVRKLRLIYMGFDETVYNWFSSRRTTHRFRSAELAIDVVHVVVDVIVVAVLVVVQATIGRIIVVVVAVIIVMTVALVQYHCGEHFGDKCLCAPRTLFDVFFCVLCRSIKKKDLFPRGRSLSSWIRRWLTSYNRSTLALCE